jgi:hypothetical protein
LDSIFEQSQDDQFEEITYSWGQIGLQQEYRRAIDQWQHICINDEFAWFFADLLCDWVGSTPNNWQSVRENEVSAILWRDDQLRPLAVSTSDGQRRVETLIERWYLPRYDLATAWQLRKELARIERYNRKTASGPSGSMPPQRWRLCLRWPIFGVERLIGGIGIGYAATALQSDTWKTAWQLTGQERYRGLALGLLLGATMLGYLWYGIWRKVQVRAGWRALHLWLKGQLWAILIGIAVTLILGVLFIDDLQDGVRLAELLRLGLLVTFYAQVALAIGIVTQLLFDEKPSTAPLDVP